MADTNKTHQPTSRRLQKAREKGQIPQSPETTSTVTLIALMGAVALLGPWFLRWSKKELIEGLSCKAGFLDNSQTFIAYINSKIVGSMIITLPFFVILIVFGVAVHLFVSGWNFAPSTLQLKLDQLNPVNGLKKLFSFDSIIKLLFSFAKLCFIGCIIYFYLRKKTDWLATLQWMDVNSIMAAVGSVILGAVLRICLGLIVISVIDWFYRYWKYIENLKMSHQEVRDENRETEGPPEIKSQVRKKQYEIGMKRMLKKVPKASVVLVNPTHVAVALQYEPGQLAPVVVAKGSEQLCEKIKEIARSYGIPIIRRPALAREIYAAVKLDHPIPSKLYTAVAEVLAVIYRLKNAYAK